MPKSVSSLKQRSSSSNGTTNQHDPLFKQIQLDQHGSIKPLKSMTSEETAEDEDHQQDQNTLVDHKTSARILKLARLQQNELSEDSNLDTETKK